MSEENSTETRIALLTQENNFLKGTIQQYKNYIYQHGLDVGLVPLKDEVEEERKRQERARGIIEARKGK